MQHVSTIFVTQDIDFKKNTYRSFRDIITDTDEISHNKCN